MWIGFFFSFILFFSIFCPFFLPPFYTDLVCTLSTKTEKLSLMVAHNTQSRVSRHQILGTCMPVYSSLSLSFMWQVYWLNTDAAGSHHFFLSHALHSVYVSHNHLRQQMRLYWFSIVLEEVAKTCLHKGMLCTLGAMPWLHLASKLQPITNILFSLHLCLNKYRINERIRKSADWCKQAACTLLRHQLGDSYQNNPRIFFFKP